MPSGPERSDPVPAGDADTERMRVRSRHRAPGSAGRRGWLLAAAVASLLAVAGIAVALAPAADEGPGPTAAVPTEMPAEPRPTLPAPAWRTASPSAPATAGPVPPGAAAPSSPVAPPVAPTPPPAATAARPAPVADGSAEACPDRRPGRGPGDRGNGGGRGDGSARCP